MNENRKKAAHRDKRSTAEIVKELLQMRRQNEYGAALNVLHARGSKSEFEAGAMLCKGASAKERILGADILAQLGWSDNSFLRESVNILIPLLADKNPSVACAAGIALGHRHDPRAIEPALTLSHDKNTDARFGAVWALSGHNDPKALAGLIPLSRDPDPDVRNWATFGLAQLTELDTQELRDALLARLEDENPEIRGEALIGLAIRGDTRMIPALEKELARDFEGLWAIDAARHLALPRLSPLLLDLKKRLAPQDLSAFGEDLDQAIAACHPPKT